MKLACVNWAGAEVKVRVLGSSDLLEIGRIALAIGSLKRQRWRSESTSDPKMQEDLMKRMS